LFGKVSVYSFFFFNIIDLDIKTHLFSYLFKNVNKTVKTVRLGSEWLEKGSLIYTEEFAF